MMDDFAIGVEDGGWNRRVLGYLIAVADFLDGEGY